MDPQHSAPSPETPRAAPGPGLLKRGIALLVDSVVVGCVYSILSVVLVTPLGWTGVVVSAFAAAAAVLVRDVVLDGRSPGKKVLGMAAVGFDGAPVTLRQSVLRNSTLALGYANVALAAVPTLKILGLVVLAVGCYEVYRVATHQPRLGDRLAGGTHVVFQGEPAVAL